MTSALPPDLAIAYVTELSADVAVAVMLDEDGSRLAGPAAAAGPARDLAALMAHGVNETPAGTVMVATNGTHTLVVALGPRAFAAPTIEDLRTVLNNAPDLPRIANSAALERAATALFES